MSSSFSGHFSQQQQGREEGEDSSIFERDVEAAVPVTLGGTATPAAPTLSAAVTAPPSPSVSPLGRTGQHHQHLHTTSPGVSSHIHHPVTRASVTDRIFPTVLGQHPLQPTVYVFS